MLVFHREQEAREIAERILTYVTIQLFNRLRPDQIALISNVEYENLTETLKSVLQFALDMMPMEAQKAWHKLGAFFNFWWNLVREGNLNQISYMRRICLVSRLVDLLSRFKEH